MHSYEVTLTINTDQRLTDKQQEDLRTTIVAALDDSGTPSDKFDLATSSVRHVFSSGVA